MIIKTFSPNAFSRWNNAFGGAGRSCAPQSAGLHNQMDRLFTDLFGTAIRTVTGDESAQRWNPRLNISETAKDYRITVELPGVDEKDVDLDLTDGLLRIKGTRRNETEEDGQNFHRIESFYGEFDRSVQFPETIDEDKIEASFKNGILNIIVPKTEPAKPAARKIAIKSN